MSHIKESSPLSLFGFRRRSRLFLLIVLKEVII